MYPGQLKAVKQHFVIVGCEKNVSVQVLDKNQLCYLKGSDRWTNNKLCFTHRLFEYSLKARQNPKVIPMVCVEAVLRLLLGNSKQELIFTFVVQFDL